MPTLPDQGLRVHAPLGPSEWWPACPFPDTNLTLWGGSLGPSSWSVSDSVEIAGSGGWQGGWGGVQGRGPQAAAPAGVKFSSQHISWWPGAGASALAPSGPDTSRDVQSQHAAPSPQTPRGLASGVKTVRQSHRGGPKHVPPAFNTGSPVAPSPQPNINKRCLSQEEELEAASSNRPLDWLQNLTSPGSFHWGWQRGRGGVLPNRVNTWGVGQ